MKILDQIKEQIIEFQIDQPILPYWVCFQNLVTQGITKPFEFPTQESKEYFIIHFLKVHPEYVVFDGGNL